LTYKDPSGFDFGCSFWCTALVGSALNFLFGGHDHPPPLPKGCWAAATGCYGAAAASNSRANQTPVTDVVETPKTQTDDSADVEIAKAWERPPPLHSTPHTVSKGAARRLYEDSPYTTTTVGEDAQKEVDKVLKNKTFQREAAKIYKASSSASRELGVLAVYEKDGKYYVYSIGTPDPEVANRMQIEPVDPSLGRHVFDWHPHPWGNKEPSPADLGTSTERESPGAIRYGQKPTDNTIYQGECKEGDEC